jgi:nitrate/TMAO reductase-like tetraheme cytochrome c subunit
MAAERFVLLGLAQVRSAWFRDLSRWATSASVLIMAGIGALMWVGFKAIWEDTETNTKDKVAEIGE